MTLTRPLAGVPVVVTRPQGGADTLADALRRAGASVVGLPVVEITDPEDGGAALAEAAAHVARYRWVAFTSANAVRRFLPLLSDARALGLTRVAVVGKATAAALGEYHLTADLVPERASGAGLAEAFPVAEAPGATVLFPAAAGARPTLRAALQAKGWAVDEVVAYRTVPAPPPPAALVPSLAGAAAITFASPSAVDAYLSWRTAGGDPLPVPPIVACIGPVTAEAARAAGLEVAVVARTPSAGAVADALAATLGAPAAP